MPMRAREGRFLFDREDLRLVAVWTIRFLALALATLFTSAILAVAIQVFKFVSN